MERQRSSNSVVNSLFKGTARPNSLASGRPVRFYLYLASRGRKPRERAYEPKTERPLAVAQATRKGERREVDTVSTQNHQDNK